MRKLFQIGGLVASTVLIVFGTAAIYMGVDGRSTVPEASSKSRSPSAPPTIRRLPSTRPSGPTSRSRPAPRGGRSPRSFTSTHWRARVAWPSQMGRFVAADHRRTQPAPATRRQLSWMRRETRAGLGPQHLGHGNGALDRAQHELHGRADGPLRDRFGFALLPTGLGLGILTIGGALRGAEPASEPSESRTTKPIVTPVAPSV